MGRLIIHSEPDPSKLESERSKRFLKLSTTEKINSLFALINLSVMLNNGKPLKYPQGKGIILRKVTTDGSL